MLEFMLGALLGAVVSFVVFYQLYQGKQVSKVEQVEYHPVENMLITVYVVDKSSLYPLGQWFNLPITWKQMVITCRTIIADGFSFRYALTGKTAGNPLTRAEFERLRSLFLEKGIVVERTPGQARSGLQFTAVGRALISQFASYPLQPDLSLGEWGFTLGEQTHTNTKGATQ